MKPLCLAAMLAATATMSQADQYAEVMTEYARDHILTWLQDPTLISAIRLQNLRTGHLAQSEIEDLDRRWQQEVGQPVRPTVDPVVGNAAADFLRARIAGSSGTMTEIFIMDGRGLNVAASDPTSDYWQGDEAKFTETYGQGPQAMHIGDIEYDESTQTYQGQVSVAIADPDTGAVIGAVTVGLDAEQLF
ncbi:hypothetical protein [Pseudooceanicola sp.]|uniref:hypothetical protein n=1 Tax=Pseudooceanicola sp. TaxID=1914328 RepID=UPI0035C6790D